MDRPAIDEGTRDAELRRRVRRFFLGLVLLVALLVLATVGYVELYDHVLRDPASPPSVRALNPKVIGFEIALGAALLIALGLGLNHWMKKRR
jgi:hypothetical protein